MAVDRQTDKPGAPDVTGWETGPTTGRRLLVGTNVLVAVLLVLGIVIVLQVFAYKATARWDMTTSGINSVGEGTENLLRSLDTDIRLTSLYFETDLEEKDQQRYRGTVDDLLGLYESTNRSRVTAGWVNPLADHEKLKKLMARLREKTKFKTEIEAYAERIERYRNATDGLDLKMRGLIRDELELIASTSAGIVSQDAPGFVARVEDLFTQWTGELEGNRDQVDALMRLDNPAYSAAANELRGFYGQFSKLLKDISNLGEAEADRNPALSPAQSQYLREAGNRYASLVAAIEEETTKLQELEPLELDDLLRQLNPSGNAILVETEDDARIVDFSSVWPPRDQGAGGRRVGFMNRTFKGEEKLTSAILRVTHKEQTAVVFVRYGGQPLLMGGFMPGMPRAPYTAMKQQLEDANFVVSEWDLKTTTDPPKIDPAPTRTIYIVLKPTPPARDPMGRPSQEPPFTDSHKQAILEAIGDDGRAMFVAGWYPGPFGPIPASYEYDEYLNDVWGMQIDMSAVLVQSVNFEVGKYVWQRDSGFMRDVEVSDHVIVSGPQARQLTLPMCTPIVLSDPPPDGVEHVRLVTQAPREGLWGVKNIQTYQDQFRERGYVSRKLEGDLEGPFDLAVAAAKGDAKIVVVSSREFAADQVAFAQQFVMGPHGFSMRSRNPGNVTLLINSLHWLNDNTEFMNIGKVIDAAVLEIPSPTTVRMVQVLTIFVWPMLALVAGGVVWWVRRG